MRVTKAHLLATLCACMSCAAFAQPTVTVTIDPSVTYQTVDGWGVCSAPGWRTRSGVFYVDVPYDRIADTLINLIGITMMRGFDTRACEFNPSAGQYMVTAAIRDELRRDSTLAQAALAAGEPFRFSPNVFSPPPWMKQNNSCADSAECTYAIDPTNSLLPGYYEAYGALCSAYVRVSIDSFALPVYAISPQNEPFFNELYASCSYSGGAHYARMLAVVGPAIKRASPSTLIYGAEHMAWAYPSWEAAILSYAPANPYLDRFAVHGYTDGVHVDTVTFDSLPDTHSRPLWLSEYNWGPQTYADAFVYAHAVMKSLVLSSMSAYMAGGNLWDPGTGAKYPGYYLNAQWFRFVRPGMGRLRASSADTSLLVGAFRDQSAGSMSVVLFSTATSDRSVVLSMVSDTLPSVFDEVRVTSPAQSFVNGGTVSSSSTITVPAQGMVSLGYRHRGAWTAITPRAARSVPASQALAHGTGGLFDLAGRPIAHSHYAAGVYVGVRSAHREMHVWGLAR